MAGNLFQSLAVTVMHAGRETEEAWVCACIAVCVHVRDIPLTVSCVKARPCPALLCATHSYRPSSSADAWAISHDAMAEFLIQRHAWFVGWSMTITTRSHFTLHSISVSGTHTHWE